MFVLLTGANNRIIALPLPSKNQHIGKRIVSKLLTEGENVLSKTQFNARPSSNDDTKKRSITISGRSGLDIDSNKVNVTKTSLQRSSTVVNYENRKGSSAKIGEFESKLLGSPNSGSIENMTCAAMFGKQYLLIGNENGLNVIDFSINSELIKPIPLIRGCSFKKMQILDEYGIMITIAGKKQMIRIYKLDSLLHLIKFMLQSKTEKPIDFSKTHTFLKKITDSLPRCDFCGNQLDEATMSEGSKNGKLICQNCKDPDEWSSIDTSSSNSQEFNSSTSSTGTSLFPGKFHQRTLSNISMHLSDYIQHQLSNSLDNVDISAEEKSNVWHWATDYVKLLDSARDCITFDVRETRRYIYLTVVTHNHMIHLFSCDICTKNSPDFKFELAQTFWVPEIPEFLSVSTDNYVINKIYTIIDGKAAFIDAHSSVVTEITMSKSLIPRFEENPAWRNFIPLPSTCSLDFLIRNPTEFELPISVIPLSPTTKVPPIPPMPPTPTSPPIISPPSILMNHIKFSDNFRNNPLRRSTHRNRRSVDFVSDGIPSNKKSRRQSSGMMNHETLNLESSPLGVVASMIQQNKQEQSQPISDLISPPISPKFANLSDITSQQGTISVIQVQTATFDYAPFPAPPQTLPNKTNSRESLSFNQSTNTPHSEYHSRTKPEVPIEVPLPSTLFLATVHNISYLVNGNGESYKYHHPIRWSSPPNEISLLPSFDDVFVIGFLNTTIELASMKTGEIIRKVVNGCPVNFLGNTWRKNDIIKQRRTSKFNKKYEFDSGMRRNVFWTCKLGETYYFYRGRVIDKEN
ncbi:6773_t:CDS:2 [Funneliformis geosporum]|nr:6773_t:CDS:2 [Funneliformis geosporum]